MYKHASLESGPGWLPEGYFRLTRRWIRADRVMKMASWTRLKCQGNLLYALFRDIRAHEFKIVRHFAAWPGYIRGRGCLFARDRSARKCDPRGTSSTCRSGGRAAPRL